MCRYELITFLESNNYKLARNTCMVGLSCQDSDKASLELRGTVNYTRLYE